MEGTFGSKVNYGIAQGDMYQMFAYQKKYGAENVTLLYPLTEQIPIDKRIEYISNDGVTVKVKFVDLLDIDNSLAAIAEEFEKYGYT